LLIIHHRKPQRRQREPRRENKRAPARGSMACMRAAACLKFKSTIFQRVGHRNPSKRQDKVSGGDTARRPASASRRTVPRRPRRSMRERLRDDERCAAMDGSGRGEMDAAEQVPRMRGS
ncbi:hypothetical protein BAE44_0022861, partial [Dichanthelium oligosanthes]